MLIRSKYCGYSRDGIRLYPGKDSGSPAPPDPALVAAQIKSIGIQDDALTRLMDNTEEMQPLLKEQTQFGLDSARKAFEQAQSDREYSLERRGELSGLQDKQIDEANTFDAEKVGNERAGKAMADVGQQAALQQQATDRALARRGVDPTSGNAAAVRASTDLGAVAAKVAAGNAQKEGARTEGRALVDRAANSLAGFPTMSMQTTSQGAGFGASGISIATQGMQAQNWGNTTAISGAGAMGANANGGYNAQAGFNGGVASANAANGANDMAALGTVAGIGIAI